MSIECETNNVRTNVLLAQQHMETVLENNIIVPDSKPDIGEVIVADATVLVNEATPKGDVVSVNGTIKYSLLYLAEDEKGIQSMEGQADFVQEVQSPENNSQSSVWAEANMERLDYELLNGRKISLKCITGILVNVYAENDYSIAGIEDTNDELQTKSGKCNMLTLSGSYKNTLSIEERISLSDDKPFIKEIIRSDVNLYSPECKVGTDTVYLSAIAEVGIFYLGEDLLDTVQYIRTKVEINEEIELIGVSTEDICRVNMALSNWKVTPSEDDDGELTVFDIGMSINVIVKTYREKEICYTKDMYSINKVINVSKNNVQYENITENKKTTQPVNEIIKVNEPQPLPDEICNVLFSPVLSQTNIEADNLQMEGYIDCKVLYISENSPGKINMNRSEIPFSSNMKLEKPVENMRCNVDLKIAEANWEMASDDEVKVFVKLDMNVMSLKKENVEVVTGAEETDLIPEKAKKGVTLYYSNEKEEVWDVAKKYNTTISNISELNGINPEVPLNKGQKILIVK